MKAEIYTGDRGEMRIWGPHMGIVVTQVHGAFAGSLVPAFMDMARRAMTAGVRRSFHEWSGMTDYDADGRQMLTRWTLENRRSLDAIHIVLSSPLVRLAVQVANVALGGFLVVHATRRTFDEALLRVPGVGPSVLALLDR